MKRIQIAAVALLALLTPAFTLTSTAQNSSEETIFIDPLFQYPQAPDSMRSINERSDFLVQHFWEPMDFKSKQPVDQNALNDAFQVFVSPMRWAQPEITDKAVKNLLASLAKNPLLSIQFTRAAEETLYGPRAIYWHDPTYLKFVNGLLSNKKVPAARKERYKHHKAVIENTLIGQTPAKFDYETPTGNPSTFQPDGVLTVIEFGDPGCDDCRFAKLKMETDITFSDMVEKGQINVMFIIPDPDEGWQTQVADYSPKWHVGASDSISDIYDLRTVPSFYVVDRDGKLLAKNTDYRQAIAIAVNQVQEAGQNNPQP